MKIFHRNFQGLLENLSSENPEMLIIKTIGCREIALCLEGHFLSHPVLSRLKSVAVLLTTL